MNTVHLLAQESFCRCTSKTSFRYSFTRIFIEMAARGRCVRVSQINRERLIEAFEGNEQDYLELAVNLNINKSTARSIVATYLKTGRRQTLARGRTTHNKMDDEMQTHLQGILDANPILTLLQTNASLSEHLPEKPGVSTATIARALDGMMITLKLVEDVPDARNSPEVLNQRFQLWVFTAARCSGASSLHWRDRL